MTDPAPLRRSPVPPARCRLARSFDVLGDRWALLILRGALYGMRRFEDFQAELAIPRTVLSARLAGLVDAGLLERRTYRNPGSRSRPEYWLTPKGDALRLPFIALTQWADRWLGNPARAPVVFHDRDSGDPVRAAMVDCSGREVAIDRVGATVVASTHRAAVELDDGVRGAAPRQARRRRRATTSSNN